MEILTNKKVLFIQTAFIGDAILCLPAIQMYKKNEPNTQIAVLCIPSTEEIFRNSPAVNNIIVFDKKGKDKSFFRFLKFSQKMKEMKFDKIYSFHRSFRTAFMVLKSNVKESYGFDNATLKHIYKHLIEYKPEDHEVKRNLSLVGFNFKDTEWQITPEICLKDKGKINEFIENNELSNFLVIAPGSIWETKKYPQKYFRDVINYFETSGLKIVLIGSAKDAELCESLSVNNNVISAAGMFSLPESVELLRRSKFLISNDSSPAHLGMCANIPVLMIYCSTIPGFGFYPYNKQSSWISFEGLDCKPCGIHGYKKCPLGHFKCGYELKPESVINKLKEKFLQ